jgi:hypothetical protein
VADPAVAQDDVALPPPRTRPTITVTRRPETISGTKAGEGARVTQSGAVSRPATEEELFDKGPGDHGGETAVSRPATEDELYDSHPELPSAEETANTEDYPRTRAAITGATDFATRGLAPAMAGAVEASKAPPPAGYTPITQAENLPIGPEEMHSMRIGEGLGRLTANWLGRTNDPQAVEAYERGRASTLRNQELLQHEHFPSYLLGQLGAALTEAAGSRGIGNKNLMQTAITGGINNALWGAGSDISAETPPGQAAINAPINAAFGAAGAPIMKGIGNLAGSAVNRLGQLFKAGVSPAKGGVAMAYDALAKDEAQGAGRFTPEAKRAANAAGTPVYSIDEAGAHAMAEGRAAMDRSPAARNIVEPKLEERARNTPSRVANFIDRWSGGGKIQDLVKAEKQKGLPPAYARAYTAGNREIQVPYELTQSKTFATAVRKAIDEGRDWAIKQGVVFNPPRVQFGDNFVKFLSRGSNEPIYPNIQFWDYVQRALREMQKGEPQAYARIGGIIDTLQGSLDSQVPEFGEARKLGAWFFGANDAFEAGRNFVGMHDRTDVRQIQRAIAAFDDTQKKIFAAGFADKLAERVGEHGNNPGVINDAFIRSGPARAKILMALGKQRADELEALLYAEGIVQRTNRELTGNSKTNQFAHASTNQAHNVATMEAVSEVSGGTIPYLIGQLGKQTWGKLTERINKDAAPHIVRTLFGDMSDPETAKAMAAYSRSKPTMEFIRNLAKATYNASTTAGAMVAPHDIGPVGAASGTAAAYHYIHPGHEHDEGFSHPNMGKGQVHDQENTDNQR